MKDMYDIFEKSGLVFQDKNVSLVSISQALERDVRRYPQNLTSDGGVQYDGRK